VASAPSQDIVQLVWLTNRTSLSICSPTSFSFGRVIGRVAATLGETTRLPVRLLYIALV